MVVDSSFWTGRTHSWRWLIASNDLVAFKRKRDAVVGEMYEAFGFGHGYDPCRDMDDWLRLYWRYQSIYLNYDTWLRVLQQFLAVYDEKGARP